MKNLEDAILEIVHMHLDINADQRQEDVLMFACHQAATAGWVRGAATAQARLDQEIAILRQELKAVQTELTYAKVG